MRSGAVPQPPAQTERLVDLALAHPTAATGRRDDEVRDEFDLVAEDGVSEVQPIGLRGHGRTVGAVGPATRTTSPFHGRNGPTDHPEGPSEIVISRDGLKQKDEIRRRVL